MLLTLRCTHAFTGFYRVYRVEGAFRSNCASGNMREVASHTAWAFLDPEIPIPTADNVEVNYRSLAFDRSKSKFIRVITINSLARRSRV